MQKIYNYFCRDYKNNTQVLETKIFSDYILKFAVATIMFGMGLTLTTRDFKNIFLRPKSILVGLFSHMIILPLIAFLICLIPGLTPAEQVGLILVSLCPGGAIANLLNYLLKGNLALSISMAVVNSFLTQFSIPILLNIALYIFMRESKEVNLPVAHLMFEIFVITLVPVFIGMFVKWKLPNFTAKFQPSLSFIMPTLLAVAMIGAIFIEKKEIVFSIKDYIKVFPHTFALNVISMLAAYYIGIYMQLRKRDAMTIAIETGLQNTGLALFIALGSSMLNNPEIAVPASVFALFSFFTTLGFGMWASGRKIKIQDLFKKMGH